MNNDMIYTMFLNSIRNMSEEELKNTLEKTKGILNESDYNKLLELIKKERQNFN